MYAAKSAAEYPGRPAIVMAESGETLTFAAYEAASNRMAHLLRDFGLVRADHMALFMDNEWRMLVTQGGAERTGLYYTPVNSYLSADEAAYIINDSGSKVVVVSGTKAEVAVQLPALCPGVERWVMTGGGAGSGAPAAPAAPAAPFAAWDDSVAAFGDGPISDEQQGAPMMYSSGTTGRPKGILRPLPKCHPGDDQPGFMGIMALWRLRLGMVYLSPAPLYHTAPQVSVALTLRMGSTAVVMEHFDAAMYLELVARHRVTHSQVVPTMFSRLLKLPAEVREAADVSSLEVVIHAAAPCPVPVKQQMIEWFGPILLEYYAATEGNGCTFCDSDDWLQHPGTVGRAVLGQVHILDDDGQPCAPGVSGTVWFGGATSFEYFNDAAKTAESRNASGDTSTVGDVGYLTEDGHLFLTDRKTHMIISGGVNIYPQEAENLLVTHPKVMDAAVIGVPDEDLGEVVKAVVQPVPGVVGDDALAAELVAFCRDNLAHYKCPRSVDFDDDLPRLPTGKLYKRLLRDRYWADHETRVI
jgi:long-chain acyl-CoA synthetase